MGERKKEEREKDEKENRKLVGREGQRKKEERTTNEAQSWNIAVSLSHLMGM